MCIRIPKRHVLKEKIPGSIPFQDANVMSLESKTLESAFSLSSSPARLVTLAISGLPLRNSNTIFANLVTRKSGALLVLSTH